MVTAEPGAESRVFGDQPIRREGKFTFPAAAGAIVATFEPAFASPLASAAS